MKFKFQRIPYLIKNEAVTGIIRIMKISFIFLFIFSFQLLALNTKAQDAVIELKTNSMTVGQLINEIEKQTDYLVVYSNREVDANRKVDVQRKSDKVSSYLNEAFAGTDIGYDFENNYIVLMKKANRNATAIAEMIRSAQQQGKTITGKVVDANGEPIIGANIIEVGTTNGTVTDIDGNFSLKVADNATIRISYIGYLEQEINTAGKTSFNITLVEDTQTLEEVVVVGYGTQRKGEVASAITSIRSDNFIKIVSPDAAQLIRGKVAGLSIIMPDANPTSQSQISLRGITTLKANASPLVLIDGIPGSLNSVSPEEIDQIDVLKDGSAAAIYGTRGTNGVILITTKNVRGEIPTSVDVNSYFSFQQITKRLPFMSTEQYRELVKLNKPGAEDLGANTNWLDEVMQKPLTQVYNISLRGGTKETNYVASFEYRGLNGLIKRTNNQMIYPRMEITHRMFNNKLKINAGINGYRQYYFSGSDGGSYNPHVYRNALTFNPTAPIKDASGNWTESPSKTDYFNPLALIWEVEGENKATSLRLFSNVTFTPITGVDIKYLMASTVYNQTRGYYETKKHISTIREGRNGFASRGTTRSLDDLSELTIQYNNIFSNNHSLTLLAGYSWMQSNYQNYWMQNFDFPSDDYTYNNMGTGKALQDGRASEYSYQSENKLIGYFGRLNYNYKEKYMLSASIRYEGSSKFGKNHKWGTFPAISGAWNIKNEDFLKDFSLLSSLKLRAGFGVTGTEPSSPYMSLNTLIFSNNIYFDGEWIKSLQPGSNPNPDLRWEKKEETNIGIDVGFWGDRLTSTIDIYKRNTKDLLWDYTVPSPPYLYSSITANAGSIENKGIEISFKGIPIQNKQFQWVSDINYSINKNTLISLSGDKFVSTGYSDQGNTGEPIQQNTHRIQEGEPLGNFYGFKSIDIDDNGHWIIEGADGKPKPISEQQPTDKKVIGNGLPKHYLNWNNSLNYRNIDFTLTMRGAFKFEILNMTRLQYEAPVMLSRGNILNSAYHNVYGKRPLADSQELQYVSYYIENGDYWKIDNLTVGYNFKPNKFIQNCRVYVNVSNLFTFTGYSGIDPEVNISGLAPGCDDKNRYPAARTYSVGISFKF
jgi:TonB-linked SusC/RagA family outer membrane protein